MELEQRLKRIREIQQDFVSRTSEELDGLGADLEEAFKDNFPTILLDNSKDGIIHFEEGPGIVIDRNERDGASVMVLSPDGAIKVGELVVIDSHLGKSRGIKRLRTPHDPITAATKAERIVTRAIEERDKLSGKKVSN